jgi:hypothetical protein
MREKLDVDDVLLEEGQQVVLIDQDDDTGLVKPVLLVEIVDTQQPGPLAQVRVVQLLQHPSAHLFALGETFEALGRHLSRKLATMPKVAGDERD